MSGAVFEWLVLEDGQTALLIRDAAGRELVPSEAEVDELAVILPHLMEFTA